MTVRFKFRKEKLVLDEYFYMFQEFVNLWNYDKSNAKVKANKFFLFIFYLCDLTEENHYRDLPQEKREKEALFRVYKDSNHKFPEEDLKFLEPAIDCYIRYNTSSEERILNIFDDVATNLRIKLEETNFETVKNEIDGIMKYSTNSKILTKGLQELEAVKKIKSIVVASIKKDTMSQAVRGKLTLSPNSKGAIELDDFSNLFTQYEN